MDQRSGFSASKPWWAEFTDDITPQYAAYIEDESRAVGIKQFCPIIFPGIYQTENYARLALPNTWPFVVDEETRDRQVQIRMARQWHLLEKPNPPKLHHIIDEGVLYRQICTTDTLHEQLINLTKLATLPFVTIQILPFARDNNRFVYLDDFFTLLDLGGQLRLYFEDINKTMEISQEKIVFAQYQNTFRALQSAALSPEDSLALITKTARLLKPAKAG